MNKNQHEIKKKIQLFLEQTGRDKEFIKEFEQGYCTGISSLWLYAKWLQTQPKTFNKQININ